MKIVITDPIVTIPSKYFDELKALGAEVYDDVPLEVPGIIERLKDAEVATANYIYITKEVIDSLPKLKYIIVPAVGYDWVDADYAKTKGVKVINCPTFVTLSVAEHAIGLIFALARRLNETTSELRKGNWDTTKFISIQLSGKKLGLIGYGNVGKMIEQLATPLGMKVTFVNSKSSAEDVDNLLTWSDVVCICAPLNDSTKGMINERRLSLLKSTALLINVGRGAIIDQMALTHALKRGEFAGAGLDVFVGEPGAKGALPSEIHELVSLPNVISSPHSAYNTLETRERLGAEMVDNIKSCINETPINIVN